MATKKIRGVPWMTKIDSDYQFSDGLYPGWHPGQAVFTETWQRAPWSNDSGQKIENETWWQNTKAGTVNFTPSKLFGTTLPHQGGAYSAMNNKLRYNTSVFIGAYTNNDNFYNNTFTYPSDSRSSMIRNAIGFSCQSNIAGSHSDNGGDAQAWIEKVGLFYAHPLTFKRYMFIADEKVAGSQNLNSKYGNLSLKYYTYRISSSGITYVRDERLVLMGMGFQTVHTGKSMSRDSRINVSNMRIIVGDGTGLVNKQYTNRIMMLKDPTTTISDHKYEKDASYTF